MRVSHPPGFGGPRDHHHPAVCRVARHHGRARVCGDPVTPHLPSREASAILCIISLGLFMIALGTLMAVIAS